MDDLHAKIDAIMSSKGGGGQLLVGRTTASAQFRKFSVVHYNVTNMCAMLIGLMVCPCMGPTIERIVLDEEEAVHKIDNFCIHQKSKRPYAQLQEVNVTQECGCCWTLTTAVGVMSPQCGCSEGLVRRIADEMQERKVHRGNIAQIKVRAAIIRPGRSPCTSLNSAFRLTRRWPTSWPACIRRWTWLWRRSR